ncbi:MAG: hypothetical protein IPL61_08620 [Myxococcales bacterium]|nr:hypothetical protein [Myxococcales bacterium]
MPEVDELRHATIDAPADLGRDLVDDVVRAVAEQGHLQAWSLDQEFVDIEPAQQPGMGRPLDLVRRGRHALLDPPVVDRLATGAAAALSHDQGDQRTAVLNALNSSGTSITMRTGHPSVERA